MVPVWFAVAMQAAPLIEWEPIKVPVYIVAFGAFIVFMAKAALYGQQFASKPKSQGGTPAETEILILVRQGHEIQQRHLDELKLLRSDIQESRNTSREMLAYLRRHDEEAAPTREKIHELHASYFEGEDG